MGLKALYVFSKHAWLVAKTNYFESDKNGRVIQRYLVKKIVEGTYTYANCQKRPEKVARGSLPVYGPGLLTSLRYFSSRMNVRNNSEPSR